MTFTSLLQNCMCVDELPLKHEVNYAIYTNAHGACVASQHACADRVCHLSKPIRRKMC